jgi:hypothetical protein
MHKKLLKVCLVVSCFILAACEPSKQDYAYLMTHPKVLEEEAGRCQSIANMKCEAVAKAANDFSVLLNQRQNDPEKFGESIMQLEYQISLLKTKLAMAAVGSVQAKELMTESADKQQEVDIMLAVVGATSGVG